MNRFPDTLARALLSKIDTLSPIARSTNLKRPHVTQPYFVLAVALPQNHAPHRWAVLALFRWLSGCVRVLQAGVSIVFSRLLGNIPPDASARDVSCICSRAKDPGVYGRAFAGTQVATIGALPARRQASGGLPLHHDLLDASENWLAFGKSEAERFRLQIPAFDGCDLANLLVAILGDHDYLQFEDHGRTLRPCQSVWSWQFASRRSNRSGWNFR